MDIVALSTPAPKSLLIPTSNAVRTITTSADKKAEVPVAVRSGGSSGAAIRSPRREVLLPSQEPNKGAMQFALYVFFVPPRNNGAWGQIVDWHLEVVSIGLI